MAPEQQNVGEQAPPPAGAAAPAGEPVEQQQPIAPEEVATAAEVEADEVEAAEAAEVEADEVEAAEAEAEILEGDALAELRERASKADVYLDLAQRTQADFENFRKRMTRDVQAAEARGTRRLAKELLPALDNLERALAAVETSESDEEHHLTKGLRLVQSELAAALSRTGIDGFAPAGETFDPTEHEAVAQQPVEGFEAGTVVEVVQAGYRLNGAILRPARVIVAG